MEERFRMEVSLMEGIFLIDVKLDWRLDFFFFYIVMIKKVS